MAAENDILRRMDIIKDLLAEDRIEDAISLLMDFIKEFSIFNAPSSSRLEAITDSKNKRLLEYETKVILLRRRYNYLDRRYHEEGTLTLDDFFTKTTEIVKSALTILDNFIRDLSRLISLAAA